MQATVLSMVWDNGVSEPLTSMEEAAGGPQSRDLEQGSSEDALVLWGHVGTPFNCSLGEICLGKAKKRAVVTQETINASETGLLLPLERM